MDAVPPKLPISLPLKIRLADDAFAVEDAGGRIISRTRFDEDPSRRAQSAPALSKDEAREIAQMIARLLTDVESRRRSLPSAGRFRSRI